MPGPMGGGRGGGFSGGSRGGGGGRSGGGFGGGPRGPMHHGPHHHHHGPMFFGPMFHRPHHHHHGGGCLGSLISSIIAILLIIIIFAMLILTMCTGDFNVITYDEQEFQQYANGQYYAAFSDTEDYEGNILLVFLTYDGYDGYDCIAWGGNNIDSETETLFGSYFQSTVNASIPDYYEYALTKSLKQIVNTMTKAAPENVSSSAVETGNSVLINNTMLQIDKATVNTALVEFTEKTGYPIAIVVEDGDEVFGSSKGTSDNGGKITLGVFILLGIILAVVFFANKSKKKSASKGTDKTDPDAGQGKYDPNTGEWK